MEYRRDLTAATVPGLVNARAMAWDGGVQIPIPRRLGRYTDLALLGQGGMGAVYRARDPELDRAVAIKVVLDTHPDLLERFRREARALARLTHPNVVQVFDFGLDDGGHPYFVMELVDGVPVDALVKRRGRLSALAAARLLRQAADGLRAAHEAGVIHRDVKPANMIWCGGEGAFADGGAGGAGRLVLVDFGLARVEGAAMLTAGPGILGTPTYMSPEQVEGHELDGRADLYSLGISAFHLLAGRPPFEGSTAISLAMKHVSEELPSVIAAAPVTPPPLAALVVRLCQKDPARRPASAAAVVTELDGILGAMDGAEAAEGSAATLAPERAAALATSAAAPAFAAASGSDSAWAAPSSGAPARVDGGVRATEEIAGGARRRVGALTVVALGLVAFPVGMVLVSRHRPPTPPSQPAIGAPAGGAPSTTPPTTSTTPPSTPTTLTTPQTPPPPTSRADPAPPSTHARPQATGPVRVGVLRFKNLGGAADRDLDLLVEGLGETVLGALVGSDRVRVLERNQLAGETGELDLQATKYFDRDEAVELGRMPGVEVAVQGAFQRAGGVLRVTARFVRVETGEVLDTVVVTRPVPRADRLLKVQDEVAAELRARLLATAARVRP